MIIYLINCLCLIMCHFVAKRSTDYSCGMFTVYYACCCTPAFILGIFEMIRDSPRNTTLLGDFSQPSFFSVSRWRGSFSILR